MLKPAALAAWRALQAARGQILPPPVPNMPVVVPLPGKTRVPPGYRALGNQAIRIDMAEKLLLAVHGVRAARTRRIFAIDPAMAVSMGLTLDSHARLLRQAGFAALPIEPLPEGAFGPPAPQRWRWHPGKKAAPPTTPAPVGGAFADLARLVR